MSTITGLAVVVVPVEDQQRAADFYVEALGMAVRADFDYPTGERWLEVVPEGAETALCLVQATPDRPAGIETGIVLTSADVRAELDLLRARGVRTDAHLLEPGVVVLWAGAPLAGRPDQFRLYDVDGNSLLVVAAPPA